MPTFKSLVVGIDPGLALTGYALLIPTQTVAPFSVLEYGVIRTSVKDTLERRLAELYTTLRQLLATYQPVMAGCEKVFFSKNVKTAIDVNQARGVILLAIEQSGIPVTHLTPTQIKQSVTGYGSADKTQVQYMVQQTLKLKDLPSQDDAADALAVAIATATLIHQSHL